MGVHGSFASLGLDLWVFLLGYLLIALGKKRGNLSLFTRFLCQACCPIRLVAVAIPHELVGYTRLVDAVGTVKTRKLVALCWYFVVCMKKVRLSRQKQLRRLMR